MEGSDDRILASTLRENEPAPAPSNVRLASRIDRTQAASTTATSAHPELQRRGDERVGATTRAMSFSDTPNGGDGAGILNGRGLY